MTKMSIEQKAKAYDEALERAKEFHHPQSTTIRGIIEEIFPELRESEDERIRKEIISIVKEYGRICEKEGDPCSTLGDCLAYLEKQKINTEGDFGRGYDCGYQAGYAVAMNKMKPKVATATLDSEKQQEQKPVARENDFVSKEWSEEDEEMMTDIIESLEYAYPNDNEFRIAWLKSLRPPFKPSEDEERLINTSISFLKDFADKGYENAVECIDWLKSKLNGNTCK